MRIDFLHSENRVHRKTANPHHKKAVINSYPFQSNSVSFKGFWEHVKDFFRGYRNSGYDMGNYWRSTNTTSRPLGDGGTEPYVPRPVPDYEPTLTEEEKQKNVEEAIANLNRRRSVEEMKRRAVRKFAQAETNAEIYLIENQPGLVDEINKNFLELYDYFKAQRKKANLPVSFVIYTRKFENASESTKKYHKTEAQYLYDTMMEPFRSYMHGFPRKYDGPFIPFESRGDNGKRDRIFVDVFPVKVAEDKHEARERFAKVLIQKQDDFNRIRNFCVVKKKAASDTNKFDPQTRYEEIRREFRDKKWGYLLSGKILMAHIEIKDFDKLFKGENRINDEQQRKLLKLFKDSKNRGVLVTTTVSDLNAVPKMFRTRSAMGFVIVDKPLYGREKLAARYGMYTFDNASQSDILNNNDLYERKDLIDELENALEEEYGAAGKEIDEWAAKQEKIALKNKQLIKASDFAHN